MTLLSPEIHHPLSGAIWKIENSHLVTVPEEIETYTTKSLMVIVQLIADRRTTKADKPPIGPINFRFEVDEDMAINMVHCHFTNKSGKLLRFMRLRRMAGDML